MQYITVSQELVGDFDDEVTDLLSLGWKLYGNPYTIKESKRAHLFCQALVKDEDTEESL